MPNNSFSINEAAIESQLSIIEENIKEIVNIIHLVYEKMQTLDESVWKGIEKDKIDQEYMPYLKKLDEETEKYLMSYVEQIRASVNLHKEVELTNRNIVDNI